MTLSLMFLLLIGFIAIGIPIAFSIGLSSLIVMALHGNMPLGMIPQKIVYSADSFVFLAVPFFILAGEIMGKALVVEQIVAFSNSCCQSFGPGITIQSTMYTSIPGNAALRTEKTT